MEKKMVPWYVTVGRVVAFPFCVVGLVVYFCRWKYAVSMKSVRAVNDFLSSVGQEKERVRLSRFPLGLWFVSNFLLTKMHKHLVKEHICNGAPDCLHSLRLLQQGWNICRKNGTDILGFLEEIKECPRGNKVFSARDLGYFKNQKGGVFTPPIRDFLKVMLRLRKDDLKFIVWCYCGACELLQRNQEGSLGMFQPIMDQFIKNRALWCGFIGKIKPIVFKMLSAYPECMIHVSLDFKDNDVAHLWAKVGQRTVIIRQLMHGEQNDEEIMLQVDEYCRMANDAGARIYTHYLEADRQSLVLEDLRREQEAEKARQYAEKKEEAARRKAERKAKKEAKIAAMNDPNAPKTPETVLVGRCGRFEFIRATKGKKRDSLDIHDVEHRKWFRNLTAPKALAALVALFDEYRKGSDVCVLPLNDPGWKASFTYGDLQSFFNAELQTWSEAHPNAAADEKYRYQSWYRIIPDGQPLLN